MSGAFGLCACSRWNGRNDTRSWKWKINISSVGECFQANDSQLSFFDTFKVTISVQNYILKVNYFL